jgi:hypothetical protein
MPTLTAEYVDNGSGSSFYRIGKGRGFKEFDSKCEAQYAHKAQSLCAAYCLAPQVYSDVGRIKIKGKLSGWGYVTQIARLLNKHDGNCGCDECDELDDRWSYDFIDVTQMMEEICGIIMNDVHKGNFGFIKKDGIVHLVCIDFGTESIEFIDEEDECYA